MRKDLFVYLSGPITGSAWGTIEEHVARAVDIYLRCLRQDIPAFCPHLSGMFPSAHLVVEYDRWLHYDFAVIDRCTHMILLPNWQHSKGALLEKAYAEEHGIPVLEWPALP